MTDATTLARSGITPRLTLTAPLKILVRLLITSAVLLGALQLWKRPLIEPMIPLFRVASEFVAQDFKIDDVEIVRHGPNETLQFTANLAAPIFFGGKTLYPFGWNHSPAGGYRVYLTLGGLAGYVALLLIIVIAWPTKRVRNYVIRLALSLLFAAVLLAIDIPFTVAAELRNVLYDYAPHEINALMVWSRFLMGGGGYTLAILFAGVAIAGGDRLSGANLLKTLVKSNPGVDDARAWNLRHREKTVSPP
jgi:hypothetical protein